MGNSIRVKVTNKKVAPPFTKAEFDIMYNEGISMGRENSKHYLRENPDTALEIENAIRGKYGLPLLEIEAANSVV